MLDLAFILLLATWSAGVGGVLLRRLDACPERPADTLALAVPLGLGTLALGALGLGELGLLTTANLLVLLLAGVLSGGRSGIRLICEALRNSPCRPREWADIAVDLAIGLCLLGTLLTALAPVTDGDALCYHLQVPKLFLSLHANTFDPDLHETVYPLLAEMQYAAALAIRGPVACRLVQWLLGLSFAANVTAIARPTLGGRARWAGAVALLVPAVSNGMSAPLNDVALAAYGNAALFAWLRWRDRPGFGTAAVAGILMGMALGVKYPALVWFGLLGTASLALVLRHSVGKGASWTQPTEHPPVESRPRLTHAAVFIAAAVLVGGGWYLRSYVHTGNPVYPFFRHTFGGAGLDEVLDPASRPMRATPLNVLTALVPMTLDPARFDSVSHQFGPAFLLFLPGLLLFRPPRGLSWLVALGYAFLTICLARRQSMRFVLIAVGPMAVGVAWVAATCSRRGIAGRLAAVALLLVLGFESTLALGRARHGLPVVLGRERADDFLARREPTFVVGRWIDAHLPPSARVVGQDHRGFYIPRPYTMELAHRRRTGLGRNGESAERIAATLADRGFTHLLLCPPVPEDAVEFDPTLGRRLADWLGRRTPIYRADLADADGVVRRYALYELGPAALTDAGRDRR